MAYSSITNPRNFMNTVLYTGNATARSITGVGFQPDWVWIKPRDNGLWSHNLTDAVRGPGYGIFADLTSAQYNYGTGTSGSVRTFDSDGFSIGSATQVNNNSSNIVAWNWKAGGGQGSSNTDGSINTTYTSVNTTSGLSISQYEGNSTTGATVGHGLGATPKMIMIKSLGSENWEVYNENLGNTKGMYLNGTDAAFSTSARWNNTSPTNSVWTMGNTSAVNGSGVNYIAYCFAEKQGYSKFGSYIGNGNSNGPFINLGFKPAFIMAKKSSDTGGWQLRDNKRTPTGNLTNNLMYANASSTEQTTDGVDFLSNGWKLRNSAGDSNASGATYIYMAFAEEPFVASNFNVATAR